MAVRDVLYRSYCFLQRVIAPNLKYSQELYEEFLKSYLMEETSWLDLGCGHQILPPWRRVQEKMLVDQCRQVIGIDSDILSLNKHESIHQLLCGDISCLPFKENTFHVVTANMVLEHIREPINLFAEVHRVLKPGGVFVFHTPNVRGYTTIFARMIPESLKDRIIWVLQERKKEDVYPTYYKINSEEDIMRISSYCGLKIVTITHIMSSAQLAIVTPLVFIELLLIRLLMGKRFEKYRTNILASLRKPVMESMPQ